ncbi:MAG: DUF2497 domain-containing protein [Geminicoccaceae bacterium]|nr:DUF2497 domain-containing protein [Geminicoccaceae bacterium]MCX8099915.1 DUF2497 domain-containing protein [Geminicoccaceae bacterium]MDW8370063.1 DUF2497 domain-containing protein [Geminicoccaceae bacterium]
MSDRKDPQEPSMEEILSSIRRIIADEPEEPVRKPAETGRPTALAAVEEEELELTEMVAEPAPRATPPISQPPPTAAAPPIAAAAPLRPTQPPERSSMPAQDEASLVSPTTAQASTSALARLARAAASEEPRPLAGAGRTVEELVIELLRPQLKEWLDKNLAQLVERVVEQEVKKLARRAELM